MPKHDTVVFTGACHDQHGTFIVRERLRKAAEAIGFTVQDRVTPDTRLIVASRVDTRKAQAAATHGTEALTYPEFIEAYLFGEVPELHVEQHGVGAKVASAY